MDLVLATDIDGTFLGGPARDRDALYQLLRSLGERLLLIFVTGRAVENVEPLLADPAFPRPVYIIGDVGATLVHGATLAPVEPLDREMGARWLGEERVLAALPAGLALERQQQAQARRCSFYTEDVEAVEAVRRAVAPLGCEVLYSAGRYLDILPAGVSKGSSLLRLVEHLGLDPQNLLVAGDTLNDLSVFLETPFQGVVVGGAEPGLLLATRERADTYHAARHGAGGILEALEELGFLARLGLSPPAAGEAELVVVYHRQPFEEVREAGRVRRRRPASPNGVIPTLVGSFDGARRGAWVAWSTQAPEGMASFEARVPLDEEGESQVTVSRLLLSEEDVDLFYRRFSKEALWPVLHSFIERASFDHRHWQHFLGINRRFAEQAAAEAAPGALVWIHDYNLWLVPEHLRRLRPDLRLAFFHHTPFPAGDIFHVLPWSAQILESLLQCDYVGFHIPRYCENFVDAVRGRFPITVEARRPCGRPFARRETALSVDAMSHHLHYRERRVGLGAHPVGLDLERIRRVLASPAFVERLRRLRREMAGQKVIFCAERLDYMKGPSQRLLAYEQFLALYPVWREKVTLLDICVPPSQGMRIYDGLRQEVEQAAGRIHGRFSTTGWTPLTYLYRHVPFEELASYLAIADVAWITPLRDGLNLVAKEYVAVRKQLGEAGVLVVSEFAGCSVELEGALLTNPYDTAGMADTLQEALFMEEGEQRGRMAQLAETVLTYDVRHWAQSFLREVEAETPASDALLRSRQSS